MSRRAPTKTMWVTREGARIKVSDMDTSHLRNTVAMLRRKAEADRAAEIDAGYRCLPMLRGEMATYYCEQDIARLEDEDADDWLLRQVPCFEKMLEELGKRGAL